MPKWEHLAPRKMKLKPLTRKQNNTLLWSFCLNNLEYCSQPSRWGYNDRAEELYHIMYDIIDILHIIHYPWMRRPPREQNIIFLHPWVTVTWVSGLTDLCHAESVWAAPAQMCVTSCISQIHIEGVQEHEVCVACRGLVNVTYKIKLRLLKHKQSRFYYLQHNSC